MARQNHGPLSRAKGKLGGVVYQQYEGMQISREYQPVVKNPQTTKQVENRAKFKLSSQITAQFAEVINARLAKLSIYTRKRRAASVNAIFAVINTTSPNTPSTAISDIVAALNEKSVSGTTGPAITKEGGAFSIVAPDDTTVVYVACGYDADGKLIAKESESYDSDGTAKTVTPDEDASNSVLMAVTLIPTTEAGRATISNVTLSSGEYSNAISRAIAEGDIEISNISALLLAS